MANGYERKPVCWIYSFHIVFPWTPRPLAGIQHIPETCREGFAYPYSTKDSIRFKLVENNANECFLKHFRGVSPLVILKIFSTEHK